MPVQEPTKSFAFILAQLDSGAVHDELSEALRALNLKLREHAQNNGKAKGKIALILDLTVEKGVLMIGADIQTKAPKANRASSVMWMTDGGNVSTENPRQLPLTPRALPTQDQPRDIAASKTATKEG